jgi:hypothetical protein
MLRRTSYFDQSLYLRRIQNSSLSSFANSSTHNIRLSYTLSA